jgi:DUF218 domain
MTATVLIVFGRGAVRDRDRYLLTPATRARVDTATAYVRAHRDAFVRAAATGRIPRVVYSGGWAEAAAGAEAPPVGQREADLMLRRAAGEPVGTGTLADHAELLTEAHSRGTLENLTCVRGEGLLDGMEFTPAAPLGLVAHRGHLRRISYLARKVFGLPPACLREIVAAGPDLPMGQVSEPVAYLAARVCFLGLTHQESLLRRERRMVAAARWLERISSGRRTRPS